MATRNILTIIVILLDMQLWPKERVNREDLKLSRTTSQIMRELFMSDFKDVAHKTVAELFDMLKEKQAEVDSLKARLNNMAACYIEVKKQVEAVEHQKSLQELEISQISQANQEWRRVNGELAQALRGDNA